MHFYNTLKEDNYIDYALMMYVSEEYYEDGNDIVRDSFKTKDKNIFRRIWDKFIKFIRWIIESVSKFFKKIKSWIMGSTNDNPKEKHREPHGTEIAPPDITFQNSSEPGSTQTSIPRPNQNPIPIHRKPNTTSNLTPASDLIPKPPVVQQSEDSDDHYFDTPYNDITLKLVSESISRTLEDFMSFFNRFKSEISKFNSSSDSEYLYNNIYKRDFDRFTTAIYDIKEESGTEMNIKLSKDNYERERDRVNRIILTEFSDKFEKRLKKIASLIERTKSAIVSIDSSDVRNYEVIKRVVNNSSNFITELTKVVTGIIRNSTIEWTKFRREVYAN